MKDLYGADRMMWGSDTGQYAGLAGRPLQAAPAHSIQTAHWSYADRKAMFFDTPYRLFRPGGKYAR